jgi:hypothetical protein
MRMIVVNRDCGYIFADTIAQTPMQAIKNMDRSFGSDCSTYYQTMKHDNNVLYDVYQVKKDFPPVYDGQDQDLIKKLDKSGRHIASIAMNKLKNSFARY